VWYIVVVCDTDDRLDVEISIQRLNTNWTDVCDLLAQTRRNMLVRSEYEHLREEVRVLDSVAVAYETRLQAEERGQGGDETAVTRATRVERLEVNCV